MKKIFAVVLCCTLAFGLYNCGSGPSKKYIKVAEAMNESLPRVMNNMQMERVEAASNNEFKYYYTLLSEPTVSSEEFSKNQKAIMKEAFANNSMDTYKKDKITLVYIYCKPDRSLFAEIKFTPNEY